MNFLMSRTRSRSRKNSAGFMISTEKWRTGRQLSRPSDNFVDEDVEEDEEPQYQDITDWVTEFFHRKSDTTEMLDQDVEIHLTKKQTLILSTLVPDQILQMNKFDTNEPTRFVGVLMMADVSGYTALSERYNNTGKGGTYRLTVTLNTYLGSLIEVIYSHGGDIIKFAGDAFLALWKTDKRSFLCHTIHTVIACALIIQHSYSTYETDVKVNLRVKLAISAGNIMFAPIGSGIDMSYIIFGLPVLEAKAAESVCASGEVKLTPTAWGHCYSRNYDHVIDENGYVTVKCILYDPHDDNVTRPFPGFGNMLRQIKKPFTAIENLPDYYWDSSRRLSATEVLKKNEALNLRKTILLAEEKNLGTDIRKFMIRPVLTQIDAHQPLEYLTEMRHVSILFITLKPRESSFSQLITIVNKSYQITCEIVYKSMGCVNKIILFDKDVMMLVIFGLRGFKHESEAQAALKCGYSIKKSVSALDGVSEVSIGVTTGPVYCGVVGHPLRREFTVIGAIVNKAARLMCGFRNKITCDETTFVKSKMSTNAFTLQPSIELKGIGKSGKIYEYTEEIRAKEFHDIPVIPPILNRVNEIDYFSSWLEESRTAYRNFDGLLIVGESRLGKTRMLEWIARLGKNKGYRVCFISLTSIHSATAYLALSQIINQILDLQEPIQGFIKEEKIVQLLKVYSDDLCYLNNIIKVRFAYHEGIQTLDESHRKEKAKRIFGTLVRALTESYIIILDDLQNLDPFSWEFISVFFSSLKIFTVLSITRGKFSTVHDWLYNVFTDVSIRKISLAPLEREWIPALACQILNVDGVSNDLCQALRSKCKGMPGLVESFIIHLFSTGALEIKIIPDNEMDKWKENEELEFPDPILLHPQALDSKDQETVNQFLENESKEEKAICIVIEKDELKTDLNVQNLDALIMIQIDSLTPYQQLLLKIASVVGNIIPRDLLENIMYENNPLVTAKAVKRLFALNILSCANADSILKWRRIVENNLMHKSISEPCKSNLVCECKFDFEPENYENIPKYAFCQLMKFRNRNSRQTCYELLPMNQKREFHTRVVNYLESNKQKCTDCGGKIKLVQSFMSLVDEPRSDDSISDSSNDTGESNFLSKDDDEKNTIIPPRNLSMKAWSSSSIRRAMHMQSNGNLNSRTISELIAKSQGDENPRNSIQFQPILKTKHESNNNLPGTSKKRYLKKKVIMTTSESFLQENHTHVFDMLRAITEAENPSDWHNLGVFDSKEDLYASTGKDSNKGNFTVKIAKGVSETNFAKCTCTELNITINDQLFYHAQQADLKLKAIQFLIKYCHLSVLNSNLENIFEKLAEAEHLCTDLHQRLDSFERKRLLGKIYSLRAAACLIGGQLTAAKMEIERATKIYHINLHKVPEYLTFKNLISLVKLRHRKHRINKKILNSDSIFCLNVATLIYSNLGDERISRITASRALHLIQTVECSVVDVCDTYSNAMQAELDRGTPENTMDIEEMAVITLRQLPKPIEADELFALGKLFMATFRVRLARGRLARSIHSGCRALAISRFIQADDVALEIIPDLFYVLLARRRIEEAIDILKFGLRSSQYHYKSHEIETWYYALCLDMILDAGFALETPKDISHFAEFAISKGKSAGGGRRRLIVGLWTYWLRVDAEKKAKRFESEALSWVSHEDDFSMSALLSALRLAEGMLECLARKIDDLRKVVDLMELRSIADRELARLENDAQMLRAVYPRWFLLKANSCRLSGRHSAANGYFNQSLDEARRIDSHLEENLTIAALSKSMTWLRNARTGTFSNWRVAAEQARTAWHELMYKISVIR
ncbi:unnamed protein product [Arctia plantaginis]|uniref:Guanylate cyclase domain-containing protein n=1 Tax=Arctia plantaginis TaxID=874455 RepID=A0A8S0ZXV9_ARCPL|nr:unnamed protein product [Arctia plantaginis]CAB3238491.1 unnamed protein product [Arctia plantaginis]